MDLRTKAEERKALLGLLHGRSLTSVRGSRRQAPWAGIPPPKTRLSAPPSREGVRVRRHTHTPSLLLSHLLVHL